MANRKKKVLVGRYNTRPLFPNFVKQWRETRGITSQSELGRLAGLTPQIINRLEGHSIALTLNTMEKLSNALDCRPGDVLSTDPTVATAKVIEDIYKRLRTTKGKSLLVKFGKILIDEGL